MRAARVSPAGDSWEEADVTRVTRWSVVLVVFAVLSFCVFTGFLSAKPWGPLLHGGAEEQRVYAYRGWQSTGLTVLPGDLLNMEAEGEWMYSPEAGVNGPRGHPVFTSPANYPVPGRPGGSLIGKIGEFGQPFYVGRYVNHLSNVEGQPQSGMVYLRINDDLLGDNRGYVTVRIDRIQPD